MIRSMTGFGQASAEADGVSYVVELRSLNNRYFKVQMRMPEMLMSMEAVLETRLRRHISRGSLVLSVSVKIREDRQVSEVDEQALDSYLQHLESVRDRIGGDRADIDLTALLSMPGVLKPTTDDEDVIRLAHEVLPKLVDEACTGMDQMRCTEGEALAKDLQKQLDVIQKRSNVVLGRAPQVIEEYHQRLRTRVDEMMTRANLKVDEVDLIKEIALFADRADISEETTRLAAHLDHFRQILARNNGEPAGRSLDFLAQELLREANTIASKSNDAEISRAAVDIKSAIDRIKEQVQNVE